MKEMVTHFQPSQFVFTVRFIQGYRFLDKCGEALIRLENTLDKGWIPNEIAPKGGNLVNYSLGMSAQFNSEFMTLVQREFLSFEHFCDQTCQFFEIIRETFDIRKILTPALRIVYQLGFENIDTASEFLDSLKLCCPAKDVLQIIGGAEQALSFALCTEEKVDWNNIPAKRRNRLEAKVITQEKIFQFDERLLSRGALLPERHREVMAALRTLRRQHSQIAEAAAQFDLESALETEFNSRTFDLMSFLKDSQKWTEKVKNFISKKNQD